MAPPTNISTSTSSNNISSSKSEAIDYVSMAAQASAAVLKLDEIEADAAYALGLSKNNDNSYDDDVIYSNNADIYDTDCVEDTDITYSNQHTRMQCAVCQTSLVGNQAAHQHYLETDHLEFVEI